MPIGLARTPSVAETAKNHGVSEQTIYNWRKHFCELEPADIKRLVAEHVMTIDTLKEISRRKW